MAFHQKTTYPVRQSENPFRRQRLNLGGVPTEATGTKLCRYFVLLIKVNDLIAGEIILGGVPGLWVVNMERATRFCAEGRGCVLRIGCAGSVDRLLAGLGMRQD